ncbi:tail fiber protein; host specificity [Salmonella phage KM16]|uniref:tail fiber protein; host specificity n=1 Tax=Salmonella phage KM16 TaxID=2797303 RepID=UPI002491F133|nr:tail fiber protein; host specificity [Salmonella phage KM16]
MSQLIGRSREVVIDLAANHNYNKDNLINWMRQQGNAPVVINVRGDMVSYSAGVPLFEFPGDLANEYVQLSIHGVTISGRGGHGAGQQNNMTAQPGGACIRNFIGTRLRINNDGTIMGGGGGGGCVFHSASMQTVSGGGGGRPFGEGGQRYYTVGMQYGGSSASLVTPGDPGAVFESAGRSGRGGGGGDMENYVDPGGNAWGNLVGYSNTPGAPGGAALEGDRADWQVLGNVYGNFD